MHKKENIFPIGLTLARGCFHAGEVAIYRAIFKCQHIYINGIVSIVEYSIISSRVILITFQF